MTEALKTVKKAAEKPVRSLLVHEIQNVAQAMVERGLNSLSDKIEGMTDRLSDYADSGGKGGLVSAVTGKTAAAGEKTKGGPHLGAGAKDAVKHALSGVAKGLRKGKNDAESVKVINVVESLDIGAPIRVVYNEWTEFKRFPTYMKKVEHVEQESDEKLTWRAQVFWSHRSWQSTILEQVPDDRIIWRSQGEKGYVDGAVTFHELTPTLTRVTMVLEYHPKGFMEHVGNIWRAQGRRARLEFKHFRRHVMTRTMLHPEEALARGWRGEIHDGRVTKPHSEEEPEPAESESAGHGAREEKPREKPREEKARGEHDEHEEVEEEREHAEAPASKRRGEDRDRPRRREPEGEYREPRESRRAPAPRESRESRRSREYGEAEEQAEEERRPRPVRRRTAGTRGE
ncbi:Polyketide cyclase / dehydrase and lipid transport [Sinosporangium album]|uniref:Polyketide cyclase / dehydrase and lipid transport n=1 Tax=Sinosporangium album TaxID=504805 RepID=A0A1G8C5N3_9ACTN|nr:SRPBCC family protein [Sinosporangium album]SDH40817.1 Polyketide cyclase / dehydrase and lipid transport [Sinosporangium album]